MAAEKRGFTGKLDYDFPTHGVCEVQLANDEWYRVTERDFRSFDGPRRYTIPDYTLHKAMDVPMTTKKYMKIFKNTLIDKIIDNRSRAIPKGATIVDLGVGKGFKKLWKKKHKIYTLTK